MEKKHPKSTSESLTPVGRNGFGAHTLLITGAAGYVGTMLVQEFAKREDVERVIGIDKEPLPDILRDEEKLVYLEMNTADAWQEEAERYQPDIVIHTAWQIREIYGDRPLSWKWNIDGSDEVFDYALSHASVARLIHFSTVASYGAFPANTMEHRFTEDEPFRQTDYLYAEEKRITEEHLKEKYAGRTNTDIDVAVLRPAAITGPARPLHAHTLRPPGRALRPAHRLVHL